jgi:hypothetical protein
MSLPSSQIARALAASFVTIALIAACGTDGGSSFDQGGNDGGQASGATSGNVNNGSSGSIVGGSSGTTSGGTSSGGDDGGASSGSDPNCKPLTCADQKIACGLAGNGCGGQIDCGGCKESERCGSTDSPSQCVPITIATGCTPKTCADVGVSCGQAGDGCGNLLSCGTCAPDEQCGAIGRPSQCVKITAAEADGGACVPLTLADYLADNKDCGLQSDGCGGTINLETVPGGKTCDAPAFCGGGGPSKCAVAGGGTCTKKTCADYPADVCGHMPDGCGGVTDVCGPGCTAPDVCGGGGNPNHCGGGSVTDDAGNTCVPKTTCGPIQCGQISDGCGGILDCGTTNCKADEICGGSGTTNVCGKPACSPFTPAVACAGGKNCGVVSDGCGGVIDCTVGTGCTAPSICGGGGAPNVCGGGVPTADGGANGGTCVPKTSTSCGAGQCGPFANGCGGNYDCGTCTVAGQSCGGGGVPSMCGTPQCIPKSQDVACGAKTDPNHLNCGVVADGCGGIVNCWRDVNENYDATLTACPDPGRAPTFDKGDTCGGGGAANKCGGGNACSGTYCGTQPTDCGTANGGHGSTISGTIFAPNGTLPIHDAIVYVPNAALADMPSGVTGCDACVPPSGSPFVQVHTSTAGAFRLDNVPVPGGPITLVIQKGRWRKVQTITPNRCADVALTTAQGSFGATQTDVAGGTHIPSNNIPKLAVTTGGYDAMQCLVRRIGIADEEFGIAGSVKASSGLVRRVSLYAGANGGTSRFKYNFNGFTTDATRNFPDETVLYGSATTTDTSTLKTYDGVVLTCTGESDSTGSPYANYTDDMQSFGDNGGKIFASHWHHSWLHKGPSPWNTVATFTDGNAGTGTVTEYVNTSIQKGQDLAAWLQNARGNTGTLGQLDVTGSASTVGGPLTSGTSLVTKGQDNTGAIQYADFLMPPDKTDKCGRFVLSDMHVTGGSNDSTGNGSSNNRCVGGGNDGKTCRRGSDCSGGSCVQQNGFPDNCDSTATLSDQEKVLAYMIFDLTSCVSNDPPPKTCTKKTCADYPNVCGVQSDGCDGFTAFCNPCTKPGDSCGAGGNPGVCGQIACTPGTCPAGTCSDTGVPDGCGGLAQCQPCDTANGFTCGGGGTANKCGKPSCTPLKCGDPGVIECGKTGDGCGGTLDCTCPSGKVCGLGGVPNKCGSCSPITSCPAGYDCGQYPDGCGGAITCGPNGGNCAAGEACGAGGQANHCGVGTCTPKSCTQLGAQCGQVSDGCGGIATCSSCPDGEFCNAQNLCIGATCTPKTCAQLGVECGPTGDGCGGFIPDCGSCGPGTGCGASGTPGKCGAIACTPLTCTDVGAVCGQVANGCGGLTTNCGSCPGTTSCVNGACVNACSPTTCTAAGAECGFIGDGCGGALDCGTCSGGKTCGFSSPNQCGSAGPH